MISKYLNLFVLLFLITFFFLVVEALKLDSTILLFFLISLFFFFFSIFYILKKENRELEKKINIKSSEILKSNKLLKKKVIELKEAKKKAEFALNSRDVFISNISHELRTPLNSIINFTDHILEDFDLMLQNRELQIESKDFLKRVVKNSKYLLKLINDILLFSKFKSKKITYNLEVVEIEPLLMDICQNSYLLALDKDLNFKLNINSSNSFVKIDTLRFSQILINLISNAINFTKNGFVEVRLKDLYDKLSIEIEDSGIGIKKDKLNLIFEPFVQLDNSISGGGLGLSITKKMCDDMGIKLRVQSIFGKGTIFNLIIYKEGGE